MTIQDVAKKTADAIKQQKPNKTVYVDEDGGCDYRITYNAEKQSIRILTIGNNTLSDEDITQIKQTVSQNYNIKQIQTDLDGQYPFEIQN